MSIIAVLFYPKSLLFSCLTKYAKTVLTATLSKRIELTSMELE